MVANDPTGLVALRSVVEGALPTIEAMAAVARRSPERVRALAEREGWRIVAEEATPEALEARLKVLSDRLVADLEEISAEGRQAGAYDKARVDGAAAMLRIMEKVGEITRSPDRARQRQISNDAELAATLERIDARIVELAGELAAQMVAHGEAGGAGD